jgi:phosphoglycolate phosphatase-like HAD superfamily hydrolase
VLFHSANANVAFYDSILSELGLSPLDEHGRDLCHRLSGPQLWEHLFATDAVLHARAKELAARHDYGPFYPLMEPVLELEQTLAVLASHCPLALATNRGRTTGGVIRHFGLDRFFSIWMGILDVPRAKPAPDLLLACLERAEVSADAAVFVGDTSVDYEAATAARVAFVGIGPHTGAAESISGLRELPLLLGVSLVEPD